MKKRVLLATLALSCALTLTLGGSVDYAYAKEADKEVSEKTEEKPAASPEKTDEKSTAGPEKTEENPAASPEKTEEKPTASPLKTDEAGNKEEITEKVEELQESITETIEENNVQALVYLKESYTVRTEPSINSDTVINVPSGTTVEILDVSMDDDENVWYFVKFIYKNVTYKGYIDSNYLAYSNESLIEWENENLEDEQITTPEDLKDKNKYEDIEQFPASYKDALYALKKAHPDWIFVKYNTNLDFNTAVKAENTGERSLVYRTVPAAYKGAVYSANWYYATDEAVAYYMDPRNFLDEKNIFMFEQLTYNESYHTTTGIQSVIKSTFMKGDLGGEGMTYAEAFNKIGSELQVSPFHLASRVYVEQGVNGSKMVSGDFEGYEGYYNFFNIGAVSKANELETVKAGLQYAKDKGWNTRYKSLYGGASILASSYILRGQDTPYLQKFNVTNNNTYNHQYMQSLSSPVNDASNAYKAYNSAGSLDNTFVFKIPVYKNMPNEAAEEPTGTAVPAATATPTATAAATATPTTTPTKAPTTAPTGTPTAEPTDTPTSAPAATAKATATSTTAPTAKPTDTPTSAPAATAKTTATPTTAPTAKPTDTPTNTPAATVKATTTPTTVPTSTPTVNPTSTPTSAPAATANSISASASTPTATMTLINPLEVITDKTQNTNSSTDTVNADTSTAQQQTTNSSAQSSTSEVSANNEATTAPSNESSSTVTVISATPKPVTADDSDIIKLDMTKTSTVYADTLKRLADEGMTAELNMGDGIVWTLDGQSAAEGVVLTDISLEVKLDASNIPTDTLSRLTEGLSDDDEYIELSLAHDGGFGMDATLTLPLDKAKAGQYASLYYYNEGTDSFEFMCVSVINAAKKASFKFTHASDYVIIISDTAKESIITESAIKDILPDIQTEFNADSGRDAKGTGNARTMYILLAAALFIIAAIVGIMLIRGRLAEKESDCYDGDDDEF